MTLQADDFLAATFAAGPEKQLKAAWMLQQSQQTHQLCLRAIIDVLLDVFPLKDFFYHVPTFLDGTVADLVLTKRSVPSTRAATGGRHIIIEVKTCKCCLNCPPASSCSL